MTPKRWRGRGGRGGGGRLQNPPSPHFPPEPSWFLCRRLGNAFCQLLINERDQNAFWFEPRRPRESCGTGERRCLQPPKKHPATAFGAGFWQELWAYSGWKGAGSSREQSFNPSGEAGSDWNSSSRTPFSSCGVTPGGVGGCGAPRRATPTTCHPRFGSFCLLRGRAYLGPPRAAWRKLKKTKKKTQKG